jgi:polyhydroxyalkanoate synthase
MGMFGRMFDHDRLSPDDVVDETGNVPPDVIRNSFRVLKPTAELTQYAVLWEKLWDDKQMEGFQVMGQWTRDHIPFPGKAFRETVALMKEDALMRDRVLLDGRPVSLSDVRWPVLNIVAAKDHIVPSAAAMPVCELVGSPEAQTLELPAGHVGLVMGRSAATTTLPEIFAWLHAHGPTSDADAAAATDEETT